MGHVPASPVLAMLRKYARLACKTNTFLSHPFAAALGTNTLKWPYVEGAH